jgi:hypothetical protein
MQVSEKEKKKKKKKKRMTTNHELNHSSCRYPYIQCALRNASQTLLFIGVFFSWQETNQRSDAQVVLGNLAWLLEEAAHGEVLHVCCT